LRTEDKVEVGLVGKLCAGSRPRKTLQQLVTCGEGDQDLLASLLSLVAVPTGNQVIR
jgi:hypothetical protein